jgi:hypothetical protein
MPQAVPKFMTLSISGFSPRYLDNFKAAFVLPIPVINNLGQLIV